MDIHGINLDTSTSSAWKVQEKQWSDLEALEQPEVGRISWKTCLVPDVQQVQLIRPYATLNTWERWHVKSDQAVTMEKTCGVNIHEPSRGCDL